jgi:hypothetical protein
MKKESRVIVDHLRYGEGYPYWVHIARHLLQWYCTRRSFGHTKVLAEERMRDTKAEESRNRLGLWKQAQSYLLI